MYSSSHSLWHHSKFIAAVNSLSLKICLKCKQKQYILLLTSLKCSVSVYKQLKYGITFNWPIVPVAAFKSHVMHDVPILLSSEKVIMILILNIFHSLSTLNRIYSSLQPQVNTKYRLLYKGYSKKESTLMFLYILYFLIFNIKTYYKPKFREN